MNLIIKKGPPLPADPLKVRICYPFVLKYKAAANIEFDSSTS
ncbi:hypothetical protein SAMN05660816_01179 [Niastella yeongjuensis]|nr:hypothetical protein SAMN05660816_01179 [Niastella yeongjuensis]